MIYLIYKLIDSINLGRFFDDKINDFNTSEDATDQYEPNTKKKKKNERISTMNSEHIKKYYNG